ncbi:MAG TPA: SDR family oxidoreductase [Polyangia bacterium]|jgi:UDP-glucose 4-epimerase|nr:SDR family oxidoreductase [Polyangia bacterium]
MARYLITGGAGFIGSNLAWALVARGDEVRVLDNFSTGREANLRGLEGRIGLFRGDITDAAVLESAMDGVDFVLHEAALPSVPRSIERPLDCDRVNVHGTVMVLDAARRKGVRRVVFAASSSAYGETPTLPKVETMGPAPLSPYAASKLAGEHYCQVFHKCYGLETVALRYFNVFGPRQDPTSQYAAVIPNFVRAALTGGEPLIYGDGQQSRDFCYIENCVEANLLACTAPGAAGQVFNVACAERTTLLDVVNGLSEIVGRPLKPQHAPARAGDIKHSLADITRAREILGYTGKIRFAEGLRRTVDWYRAQHG